MHAHHRVHANAHAPTVPPRPLPSTTPIPPHSIRKIPRAEIKRVSDTTMPWIMCQIVTCSSCHFSGSRNQLPAVVHFRMQMLQCSNIGLVECSARGGAATAHANALFDCHRCALRSIPIKSPFPIPIATPRKTPNCHRHPIPCHPIYICLWLFLSGFGCYSYEQSSAGGARTHLQCALRSVLLHCRFI